MLILEGQALYRNSDGELGVVTSITKGITNVYHVKMDNGEEEKHLGGRLVKDFTLLPNYDNMLSILITPMGKNNMITRLQPSKEFYTGRKLDLNWKKVAK